MLRNEDGTCRLIVMGLLDMGFDLQEQVEVRSEDGKVACTCFVSWRNADRTEGGTTVEKTREDEKTREAESARSEGRRAE